MTADRLTEGIRQRCRSSKEPLTGVVVDFAGVNFVDSLGTDQLRRLLELAAPHGPNSGSPACEAM